MSSLRDHLQRIYDAHGRLTPQIVLNEARDEDHPLHNRFEWADHLAAEKWRREQAHELIRSVRISYRKADGTPGDVRAFHAVRGPSGVLYEPAERIAQDDITSRVLLQEMEREWRQLKSRYEAFEQFWALVRSAVEESAA